MNSESYRKALTEEIRAAAPFMRLMRGIERNQSTLPWGVIYQRYDRIKCLNQSITNKRRSPLAWKSS